MAQQTDAEVDELPAISKIEYPTHVSPEKNPAVIIWFENSTALRYVWDGERGEIEEQTYMDGCVHTAHWVGGSRDELTEFALMSVSKYVNDLRENSEACEFEWGHIYEMLIQ